MAEGKVEEKRIFMNCVDSYQGFNISKFLSGCVVGASLEEVEEEEAKSDAGSDMGDKPKEGTYKINGTLSKSDAQKPAHVQEILQYDSHDTLFEHLMECDVIVYDITQDPDQIEEAVWAVTRLHQDLDKLGKQKIFILISSVMTWARSKPSDPEDAETPYTEADYRGRRPHPNFKEHIAAEKTVIKMGKTNKARLSTYVVASAFTFGMGENLFHYLFKSAWHNAPELNCFGEGNNIVPTIHIYDLAAVIQNIADQRPKARYLVAADKSDTSLMEITKAVSNTLGSGKVKAITKEEALLVKDLEQADFDALLVNLRMDAAFVNENMHISWKAEEGIVASIHEIVKEYKTVRKLEPLKLMILGPPAAGKSTIARQVCQHYKIHHITINQVIEEGIQKLERSAARVDEPTGEEEDDGEAEARAKMDQETLEAIQESRDNVTHKIDEQYVVQFLAEKLRSKPCQNQGYVIDGYPKNRDRAQELFAANEEEEEDDGKGERFDKEITPEFIFSLEATDDFLKERIMNLPESVVQGTHNTEEGLLRRLAEFRALNTEDETVLNYFDELEIHPVHLEVFNDKSAFHKKTVEKIIAIVGEPKNYGPTPEEIEAERRRNEEERQRKEAEEREENERREAEEAKERSRRQQEWTESYEKDKREEYEMLETQSLPLRNYLMKHVMPTLTKSLIECVKVRPEDPIDFVAEYLFKNNPQID